MRRNGCDQQDQRRSRRDRLEGDAIEHRRKAGHQRTGHCHFPKQRRLHRYAEGAEEHSGHWQQAELDQRTTRQTQASLTDCGREVECKREGRPACQYPDRAGDRAGFEPRQRQCGERDEIALRNENDPGDREDENKHNGQQDIDRAVGDTVLQQNGGDIKRHAIQPQG
jgi:hypothetical protein